MFQSDTRSLVALTPSALPPASGVAGAWRIFLMPIDTFKTAVQVLPIPFAMDAHSLSLVGAVAGWGVGGGRGVCQFESNLNQDRMTLRTRTSFPFVTDFSPPKVSPVEIHSSKRGGGRIFL